MTTVGDVYDILDAIAPFSTAAEWDNAGLLVGARDLPADRILLALDLTPAVLAEAEEQGTQLVVTHHPLIFQPLKKLDADGLVYRAIRAGMSVIAAHTNLDIAEGGVNDALAQQLELQEIRPFSPQREEPYHKVTVFAPVTHAEVVYEAMSFAGAGEGQKRNYSHCGFLVRGEGRFLPLEGAHPAIGEVDSLERVEEMRLEMLCHPHQLTAVIRAMKAVHPYEQPVYDVVENLAVKHCLSLGRVGVLHGQMTAEELARFVKVRIGGAGVRFVDGGQSIGSVAVVGGSGGELLAAAKKAGVQALITGEVKHNQWLEAAEIGVTLIDAGHFATENVVMEPLHQTLTEAFAGCNIQISARCTDGVHYLA